MIKTISKKNVLPAIISAFVLCLILAFILSPALYINAISQGLLLFITAVFPSLFPFFVFTKIITELGCILKISKFFEPITTKLFGVSGIGAYVLLVSCFSGYPVGASVISTLYKNSELSSSEVVRLTSFTSFCSPIFIIGTIGVSMLGNLKAGFVLLAAHYISGVLNGLLYRKMKVKNAEGNKKSTVKRSVPLNLVLGESMYSSVQSILIVGGYITIFVMIIAFFGAYHLFMPLEVIFDFVLKSLHFPIELSSAIASGVLEVTFGARLISSLYVEAKFMIVAIGFLLSFNGISIILQSFSFLAETKIPFKIYLLQKITHAVITAVLLMLLI